MARSTLSPRGEYLSLSVPGLAERRPSLMVGDTVLVSSPCLSPGEGELHYEGYVHEVLHTQVSWCWLVHWFSMVILIFFKSIEEMVHLGFDVGNIPGERKKELILYLDNGAEMSVFLFYFAHALICIN